MRGLLIVLILVLSSVPAKAEGCHGEQKYDTPKTQLVSANQLGRKRKDLSFRSAVKEAIKQSPDLSSVEKLRLRLAMALRPGVAEAIEDHLVEVVAEQGVTVADVEAQFDLDDFERLLQILIEYLPQLIEIFINLLGESASLSESGVVWKGQPFNLAA